jgi:Arylsulfotransferase (ASST)
MMSNCVQRAAVALACCILIVSGCSSSASPQDSSGPSGLQAIEHPGNVLAYDVSWSSSQAIDTELDVSCSGLDPWTVSDSTATNSHRVFLMGLVSGDSCTLKGKTADGFKTTNIKVGALPSYLPSIDLTVPAAAGTIAPGWTLVDLTNQQTNVPYSVALIDSEGRYRWYYQYPTTQAGSDSPVTQYDNGVVVGGRGIPMSYVTWQGQIVWSGPYGDHEVREAETPDQFYYIVELQCAGLTNAGGAVEEYDPARAINVWAWNLCDHYTPPADVPDWSHLNTVSLFPDNKYLLVSSRNQNELYKVERATGNIVWKMGWGGEPDQPFVGDFTIADADRFYHQHDTTVLPNGHILMFDNGLAGVRDYSRGLEVAYTYNPSGTSEAHVVWQFRHSPDILAPIWGSAQRFDNGNTLICFGERGIEAPGSQSTVDEVTSDSKVLWEFKMPLYWGIYRAERVAVEQGFVVK